ncbi:MAG TPA: M15 family metallopeptidase [Cellulomonas sp.]
MPSHRVQPPTNGLPTRRQLRETARSTGPVSTAPAVAEPADVLPAAEPVVTEAVAVRPVAGRPVAEPVVTAPVAVRPAAAPVTTAPVTTAPVTTVPTETGPAVTRPAVTGSVRTEPVVLVRRDGRAARLGRRRVPRGRRALVGWGARIGVLAVLAAVTIAVPLVQQAERSEAEVADVQADLTLPDTVQALTSSAGSVLPPASLVSSDATAVRSQVEVSRSDDRETLPGCDGEADTTAANGELPESDLCYLWDGTTQLRADAAEALAELNAMWVTKFGTDLCLSSGYRTLAEQRAIKAQKGSLAAPAGRSNHGWGLAVDLCTSQTTGEQWQWLNENAALFGWENPSWAQAGGSGPYERWHWEYTKGVIADGEYYG